MPTFQVRRAMAATLLLAFLTASALAQAEPSAATTSATTSPVDDVAEDQVRLEPAADEPLVPSTAAVVVPAVSAPPADEPTSAVTSISTSAATSVATAGATTVATTAADAAPLVAAESVPVTFRLNDSTVKDKSLKGAVVVVSRGKGGPPLASGLTDASGSFTCSLVPGTYAVSYQLPGYVTLRESEATVRQEGQVVTTTLSKSMESEGADAGTRRIRIILNWGSLATQIKDCDSHVACPCTTPPAHVSYSSKTHESEGHQADLDVDDTDWGGPETVTLKNPPPGDYPYWVHDYSGSGPPAVLGTSDVVVRVLFGDLPAGEFRPPEEVSARDWRPFKHIEVGKDLAPRIVSFEMAELTTGADLREPVFPQAESSPAEVAACCGLPCLFGLGAAVVGIVFIVKSIRR